MIKNATAASGGVPTCTLGGVESRSICFNCMAYARMATTTVHTASAQMAIIKPPTVGPGLLTPTGLCNLVSTNANAAANAIRMIVNTTASLPSVGIPTDERMSSEVAHHQLR